MSILSPTLANWTSGCGFCSSVVVVVGTIFIPRVECVFVAFSVRVSTIFVVSVCRWVSSMLVLVLVRSKNGNYHKGKKCIQKMRPREGETACGDYDDNDDAADRVCTLYSVRMEQTDFK